MFHAQTTVSIYMAYSLPLLKKEKVDVIHLYVAQSITSKEPFLYRLQILKLDAPETP